VLLKERGIIQAPLIALLIGGALSACAPLLGAGAAIGTIGAGLAVANSAVNTADSTIQLACTAYQKGEVAANAVVSVGIVPGDAANKVGIIEQYGDAACANPPTGDALSTAIWFGSLVGQLSSLTSERTGS